MSRFFYEPKFTNDAAKAEINAINSEFDQAKQSDQWHILNLLQTLSHKESTFNRFMCGNAKSLEAYTNKDGKKDQLIEFHSKYYSSNIMCLTLYGNSDLKSLEQ